MRMPINAAGLELLEDFESFVGHAYPDPYSPLGKELRRQGLWKPYLKTPFQLDPDLQALSGAPWTIGFGFTKGVHEGDRMTRKAGLQRLASELDEGYVQPILQACTFTPNENELAAMACLAWNIGMGWAGTSKPRGAKDGFRQSSVLRAHNRGDRTAAARAFALWNKAGGDVSAGLTRRRAAEAALYLRPAAQELQPMPQEIEPERPMTASTINRGAVVAGGTATVATVVEVAEQVASVKKAADDLGTWLVPALLLAVVGLCAYVVWERMKQRSGGWA